MILKMSKSAIRVDFSNIEIDFLQSTFWITIKIAIKSCFEVIEYWLL